MKDQTENSKNRNSRTNRSNISGKRTNTMSKRLDNVESMLQIEKILNVNRTTIWRRIMNLQRKYALATNSI